MISTRKLLMVVLVLAVAQIGTPSVNAASYDITNHHFHTEVDWYQGGYADCGSSTNVCYFLMEWWEYAGGGLWNYIGENAHWIPAGGAKWHASTAAAPAWCCGGYYSVYDHHTGGYDSPPDGHYVSPRIYGCRNWSADLVAISGSGATLDTSSTTQYGYACYNH